MDLCSIQNKTIQQPPLGTILQITNTAGQADVAAAGSAQPVCGVLAEVIPAAAGATIKRVVVRKSF